MAPLPPNRLSELLDARGLRLAHVAVELDVAESTVYRWATNKSAIPDGAKLKLAEYLAVEVAYLMGWDSPIAA